MHTRFLLALAAALPAAAGCNSATVYRRDQPPVEGVIVGGDHPTITVDTDAGRVTLPREAISDIDHPGNVVMTIGAVGAGLGALMLLGAYSAANDDDGDVGQALAAGILTIEGTALLVASLPPLIWGAVTWRGSVRRATTPTTELSVHVAPNGVLVRF